MAPWLNVWYWRRVCSKESTWHHTYIKMWCISEEAVAGEGQNAIIFEPLLRLVSLEWDSNKRRDHKGMAIAWTMLPVGDVSLEGMFVWDVSFFCFHFLPLRLILPGFSCREKIMHSSKGKISAGWKKRFSTDKSTLPWNSSWSISPVPGGPRMRATSESRASLTALAWIET